MRIGMFLADIAGPDYLSNPLGVLVDRARKAEAHGFASAWVPHVPMSTDALTALALVADATTRIELGTAVVPIQIHHPFAMAQQAVTVQAASRGRLVLGIGMSHKMLIEGMLGLSYDHAAARMREYATILNGLFRGEAVSFDGDWYRLNATLPHPGLSVEEATVPVLLAALQPRMLNVAGALSAGTILWLADERAIAEHVVPHITAAALEGGRPAPRIVASVGVSVGPDADAARHAAADVFSVYSSIPSYGYMLQQGAARGPADVAIVGDEAAVRRRLQAFADAGATDVIAVPFGSGPDPSASIDATWEVLAALAQEG